MVTFQTRGNNNASAKSLRVLAAAQNGNNNHNHNNCQRSLVDGGAADAVS